MADDIIIKFRPQGDKALVRAIKELDAVTKKYGGNLPKISKEAQQLTAQLKAQNLSWKKLSVSAKTLQQAYRGNVTAIEKMRVAVKGANRGFFSLLGTSRLLEGGFATLRSKMLLVSFGATVVAGNIGKLLQAFAKQEQSVFNLRLRFGEAGFELAEFASSLQNVTTFGDENINTLMALFGSYGATASQTKELTQATLDFATVTGMDLNAAGQLVAKTMGSSTNALARYGIEVDTAGTRSEKTAQIVEGLGDKFGGAAELAGQLTVGTLAQFNNAMGDLAERTGEALAGAVLPLIKAFTFLVQVIPLQALIALTRGVMVAGVVFVALKLKIISATYALVAFGTTLTLTAPWLMAIGVAVGVVVSGLFQLIGALTGTKDETEDADAKLKELQESMDGVNTSGAIEELDNLIDKMKETTLSLKIDLLGLSDDQAKFNKGVDDIALTFQKMDDEIREAQKKAGEKYEGLFQIFQQGTQGLSQEAKSALGVVGKIASTQATFPVFIAGMYEQMAGSGKKARKVEEEALISLQEKFRTLTGLTKEESEKLFTKDLVQALGDGTIGMEQFADVLKIAHDEGKLLTKDQIASILTMLKFKKATEEEADAQREKNKAAKEAKDAIDKLAKAREDFIKKTKTETELIKLSSKEKTMANYLKEQELKLGRELTVEETVALRLKWIAIQAQERDNEATKEKEKLQKSLVQAFKGTTEGKRQEIQALIDSANAMTEENELFKDKAIIIAELNKQLDKLNDVQTKLSKQDVYGMMAQGMAEFTGMFKGAAVLTATLQAIGAMIDIKKAATDAYAEAPPGFKTLAAAATYAGGIARVHSIYASLNEMKSVGGGSVGKFEQGGYVGGRRHSQGGTLIEAEQGEFVMNRRAVRSIGLNNLNAMNSGGGGAINVNITGNVMTRDFVEGELAESIKEAVRRGSDFGIG